MSHADNTPELLDLMRTAYPELRRQARRLLRRERSGHTLQPTALANEVVARILKRESQGFTDGKEVIRYGLAEMRSILTDSGRKRKLTESYSAEARCGRERVWEPTLRVLDVVRALEGLSAIDPRAREVAELRYLVGLTVEETADYLGVSVRTVNEDWTFARAWLAAALREGGD